MEKDSQQEYRRRHRDLYASSAMGGAFEQRQAPQAVWRELVSVGVTFGLGLAMLAGLVTVLA